MRPSPAATPLHLSVLNCYRTGRAVRIVVNNGIGFTTGAVVDGRSSVHATDVAKMVQAPIFHVSGDDPEACLRVIEHAFAFRQNFWALRAQFGRLFWRLIPFSGDDTVTSLYYLRKVRQERGERVVVPFSKQLPPTEGSGHLASGSLAVFTLSDLLQLVAASPVPTRIHIASHGAGIGYVDLVVATR